MNTTIKQQWEGITQNMSKIEQVYHTAAVRFGLSDSVFWMLYSLSSDDREYTQLDFCNEWHWSKQTVNSAVRSMKEKGYLTLVAKGKSKILRLTPRGRELADCTVKRIFEADLRAFASLEAEQRELYMAVSSQYVERMLTNVNELINE